MNFCEKKKKNERQSIIHLEAIGILIQFKVSFISSEVDLDSVAARKQFAIRFSPCDVMSTTNESIFLYVWRVFMSIYIWVSRSHS